jgi:hypothetical protein
MGGCISYIVDGTSARASGGILGETIAQSELCAIRDIFSFLERPWTKREIIGVSRACWSMIDSVARELKFSDEMRGRVNCR